MAPNNTVAQPDLLTSWKEIANHLGKGVRTVQRWEQQFGLPVRRPNGSLKGIVHATRQELDRWLEVQWSQRSSRNGTPFAHLNHEQIKMVRANIEHSTKLHQAHRVLMEDIQVTLGNVFEECKALSRTMTVKPKLR